MGLTETLEIFKGMTKGKHHTTQLCPWEERERG